MLKKSEFWVLTIIAVVAAAFSIANMMLFQINRTHQVDVNSRQQLATRLLSAA